MKKPRANKRAPGSGLGIGQLEKLGAIVEKAGNSRRFENAADNPAVGLKASHWPPGPRFPPGRYPVLDDGERSPDEFPTMVSYPGLEVLLPESSPLPGTL